MKNNILKTLSKNLLFKILAVLFAFTLWLIVYNLEDPTKTETMTMNVVIINKESVESLNKYYEVVDGTNKVTFSVQAPRSVHEKLDESDFTVLADMEYLAIDETGTSGTVPIEIKCTANTTDPVKLSSTSKVLKVSLEDLMMKQFIVSPNVVGKVAEGYALGQVSVLAPNVLKVSGPESIVKTVSAVVATINVDDMSMNVTDSVLPILYDSEGKEVDTTRLSLSNTTVNVSANILKTKEVPITVKPSGTPADGHVATYTTTNPTTIELKGSTSVLNSINAIEIPSELINIDGAVDDVTATIDITEYIPYGAELLDKEDATIDVTVSIGTIKNKVFSVNTDNIIVTGLPTDTEFQFIHSSVAVTISGLEEDVDKLVGTTLSGSIDLTDLPLGGHVVPLVLDIDETKYTYNEVLVSVLIGSPEPEEPSEDIQIDTGDVSEEQDSAEQPSESESESESEEVSPQA